MAFQFLIITITCTILLFQVNISRISVRLQMFRVKFVQKDCQIAGAARMEHMHFLTNLGREISFNVT